MAGQCGIGLQFEEALTQMRLGEDMRYDTWPPGHFVRLVIGPAVINGFAATKFVPTQDEMLFPNWRRA